MLQHCRLGCNLWHCDFTPRVQLHAPGKGSSFLHSHSFIIACLVIFSLLTSVNIYDFNRFQHHKESIAIEITSIFFVESAFVQTSYIFTWSATFQLKAVLIFTIIAPDYRKLLLLALPDKYMAFFEQLFHSAFLSLPNFSLYGYETSWAPSMIECRYISTLLQVTAFLFHGCIEQEQVEQEVLP